MRILIISLEVWRDDNNGGNVLSNIFQNFDAEFAQIYCSAGKPNNNICHKYFQMTDSMAISNVLRRTDMGKILTENSAGEEGKVDQKIKEVKKRGSFESLRIAREIVWHYSCYKNRRVVDFVREFSPDIIFAPCYASHYMLSLTRFIGEITRKPIISYVSDDVYSLRQFRFSPFFWINRFILRKNMRKTWPYYKMVYTMTETQKNEMEKIFHRPMKILCKSGVFEEKNIQRKNQDFIRIIYAGGIYLNRWKTLKVIAKAIKEINEEGVGKRIRLDIYTGNVIKSKALKILDDGENSKIHGLVSQTELRNQYLDSDIALHVEGFDIKNRLTVRMSFSTKIIDCLDSGCAVMAICDSKQGGFAYLKKEDAAICIDSRKKIKQELIKICASPQIIDVYREKALRCGRKNHLRDKIVNGIMEDFERIIREQEVEGFTN